MTVLSGIAAPAAGTLLGFVDVGGGVEAAGAVIVDTANADAIGLVTASPAANTVLGRLKAISDAIATMDGHVDGLEALSTALNGYVDGLEAATGGIADAAWTSGSGTMVALLKTLATAALDTATSSPVVAKPATTGGLSRGRVVTGTSGFIKAAAGHLYTLTVYNVNASVRYLHLYNKASAPTVGTDTPVLTIPLLGASVQHINWTDIGQAFSTGIAWAYTTDDIAIPATVGTSTELHATFGYN